MEMEPIRLTLPSAIAGLFETAVTVLATVLDPGHRQHFDCESRSFD